MTVVGKHNRFTYLPERLRMVIHYLQQREEKIRRGEESSVGLSSGELKRLVPELPALCEEQDKGCSIMGGLKKRKTRRLRRHKRIQYSRKR
jgi:hypothetical protein